MLPIMISMRVRLTGAMVALGAAVALSVPGVATATQIATSDSATSIGKTSASLNGTVDATNPDTGYVFQYGKTTNYDKVTTLMTIAKPGIIPVSVRVGGLSPGTTYHFRLVVAQGGYPSELSEGGDKTFTTVTGPGGGQPGGGQPGGRRTHSRPHGRASLRSHRLRVHRGVVSIPLQCRGSRGTRCAGTMTVTTRGRLGRSKKATTVRCASVRFSLSAGRSHTFKAGVTGRCLTVLRRARGHQHRATLRAIFSTHQRPLRTVVTLVRRP